MRKTNLARILTRRVGRHPPAPFEQGEIGPELYRHACLMGLEGVVSKHRERPYAAKDELKRRGYRWSDGADGHPKWTPVHELERSMRCKDCSRRHGHPFKRSHFVALRTNNISTTNRPSTW
ncbi:hypothetical protein [Bradyrhizobium ivorense]|uniref:hypothetical protein n=1 Tax=Bradyrhizobium ivorense TaxID=2511166 RepID=UPI00111EC15A|nr:hypothetical protein [Bradyrhizobium ivorense]